MKTKTSEELALICYHRPDTVWAIPMRNSWEHEGMLFDQSDWGYLLDEHGHAATRYNYDDLLELFEDYEGETQILVAVVKYTTTVDARGPVDDHVQLLDVPVPGTVEQAPGRVEEDHDGGQVDPLEIEAGIRVLDDVVVVRHPADERQLLFGLEPGLGRDLGPKAGGPRVELAPDRLVGASRRCPQQHPEQRYPQKRDGDQCVVPIPAAAD